MVAILIRLEITHVSYSGYYHSLPSCWGGFDSRHVLHSSLHSRGFFALFLKNGFFLLLFPLFIFLKCQKFLYTAKTLHFRETSPHKRAVVWISKVGKILSTPFSSGMEKPNFFAIGMETIFVFRFASWYLGGKSNLNITRFHFLTRSSPPFDPFLKILQINRSTLLNKSLLSLLKRTQHSLHILTLAGLRSSHSSKESFGFRTSRIIIWHSIWASYTSSVLLQ